MKHYLVILLILSSCTSEQRVEYRAPDLSKLENGGGIPVQITDPFYPSKAAINGQEGWVYFEFELNKNGNPVNLLVLDSYPGDVFVKNATTSIVQWTFDTNNVNRKNIKQYYLMEFKLEK